MPKYEKYINILFKICGSIFLLYTILYLLNYYHPSKISIAFHMFIIGVFCLFSKITINNKDKKGGKYLIWLK